MLRNGSCRRGLSSRPPDPGRSDCASFASAAATTITQVDGSEAGPETRARASTRFLATMSVVVVASLSWAAPPAAAQHSRVFECLQRARGGLSAETMLDGCRAEVREWLADCERTRDASVCEQAVTEEAGLAAQQKRRP
jgi:hypothetical protein